MKPIEPGCLVLILRSNSGNSGKSGIAVRKVEAYQKFMYGGKRYGNALDTSVWLVSSPKIALKSGIKGFGLYKTKNLMRIDDLDELPTVKQGEKNDFVV